MPGPAHPRPVGPHLDPPSDPWAGHTGDVLDPRGSANPRTREFDPFEEPPGDPRRPPPPPRRR